MTIVFDETHAVPSTLLRKLHQAMMANLPKRTIPTWVFVLEVL